MPTRGTIHRTVRVDDSVWLPAMARAEAEGRTLSDVIRAALKLYGEDNHPTWGSEVTPANTAHIASCPQCQVTFRRT